MATASYVLPLNMLQAGESAHVVEVMGGESHVQRMRELGMTSGAELNVIQSGSPCIIRLASQTLCFRSSYLLSVLVQPR